MMSKLDKKEAILIAPILFLIATFLCVSSEVKETKLSYVEDIGVLDAIVRPGKILPDGDAYVNIILRNNAEGYVAENVTVTLHNIEPFKIVEEGKEISRLQVSTPYEYKDAKPETIFSSEKCTDTFQGDSNYFLVYEEMKQTGKVCYYCEKSPHYAGFDIKDKKCKYSIKTTIDCTYVIRGQQGCPRITNPIYDLDDQLSYNKHGLRKMYPGEEVQFFWHLRGPKKEEIGNMLFEKTIYYTYSYIYKIGVSQTLSAINYKEYVTKGESQLTPGSINEGPGPLSFNPLTDEPIVYYSDKNNTFAYLFTLSNKGDGYITGNVTVVIEYLPAYVEPNIENTNWKRVAYSGKCKEIQEKTQANQNNQQTSGSTSSSSGKTSSGGGYITPGTPGAIIESPYISENKNKLSGEVSFDYYDESSGLCKSDKYDEIKQMLFPDEDEALYEERAKRMIYMEIPPTQLTGELPLGLSFTIKPSEEPERTIPFYIRMYYKYTREGEVSLVVSPLRWI